MIPRDRRFALWIAILVVSSSPRTLPAAAAADRLAYEQPLAGLNDPDRERFFRGRALFRQVWTPAPAPDDAIDGLGPTYNRQSCVACHPRNGRGAPPAGPDEPMRTMLVRLSLPGSGPAGGPRPHPAYGDQLNDEAIAGVPAEGRATIAWHDVPHVGPAGVVTRLRAPALRLHDLAFGALDGALFSARVAPAVFGAGLLEAVAQDYILKLAAEAKADGVRGHANVVWDAVTGQPAIGRFGAKANVADLANQVANALLGDLGLTTATHPAQNCPGPQTACRAAPDGGKPEVTAAQAADLAFYLAMLDAPPRRDAAAPAIQRGERTFEAAGCASCHRPTLETAVDARHPLLARRIIHPYTDLLVHDLGPGLADGRPDFAAGGSEWRTAPLWGLGASAAIAEHSTLLHDGRARDVEEAILWHDGEARIARERYEHLAAADRRDLLAFLRSL